MPPARRLLHLREWTPQELDLAPPELADLQGVGAKLTIEPLSAPGRYLVTPESIVGSIVAPHLQVLIEPKVGPDRFFFLLGRSRRIPILSESVELGEQTDVVEAFALIFLNALQRALRRGLLMGYVVKDEALHLIRGRVRFADQARRRYGLRLPVEVRYDEYTVDTEQNRVLKAALGRLARLRLRRPETRSRIVEALGAFEAVTDVEYARQAVPTFAYTRLSERYRQPLELARLIVRNSSIDLRPGGTPISGLLVNMDDVFEDFVFAAVGDELRRLVPPTYEWRQGRVLPLDEAATIRPQPDLSLWSGATCLFVGDAKYKLTKRGELDDLYQLLAYCSAAGLAEGVLVYAEAAGSAEHRVVHAGPVLRIESLDLASPVAQLRDRCSEIARRIAAGAEVAGRSSPVSGRAA